MKKHKKVITGITSVAGVAAGGALALGGLGATGVPATIVTSGQRGLAGATKLLPAAGKVAGVGLLMGMIGELEPKKKKKIRY